MLEIPYKKLTLQDQNYPKPLKNLDKPPQVLYIAGEILERDYESIAVVGTRRPTKYGELVVKSLVGDLVSAGATVVSGLAFGIDVLAQELALELGGRTVAVLGSGINQITPASNFHIARKIIEGRQGAIVSIYEPDSKATKFSFPQRDFLMASFAKAVLVVEAGERSGTSYTVDAALELGKEVFVVPGSIFSEYSMGCHKYIRDGATLVRSSEDIFERMVFSFAKDSDEAKNIIKEKNDANALSNLNPSELAVFNCLTTEPDSLENVAMKASLPVVRALQALSVLEMFNLAVFDGKAAFKT